MIFMDIVRSCGHWEGIALAGFNGRVEDIPIQHKEACEKNIQSQRDKICRKCFDKLSEEDKEKEVWLHE